MQNNHEEVYDICLELNNKWIDTVDTELYNISSPFEVIDNGFDIIVKLWGNYCWTSINEERPYVVDSEGEKQYQPMKEYLLEQLDNLKVCVNMYLSH